MLPTFTAADACAHCFTLDIKGGGVQAFQFRKHDFDLWVGGDGLDMYQQL